MAIPLPQHRDIFDGLLEQYLKQQQLAENGNYHKAALDEARAYHKGQLGMQERRLAQGAAEKGLRMDLLKAKIDKMRNGASGSQLTKPMQTLNQKTIQAIDNITPQIKALKDSEYPGQMIGKYLHPNKQADYDSRIAELSDNLIGALNLPKTNQSLKLVEKMVRMHPMEDKSSYEKRIENLKMDLANRRQRANNALGAGNMELEGMPEMESDSSESQDDNNDNEIADMETGAAMQSGPKTNSNGDVILYDQDGEEYHMPPAKMQRALQNGFMLSPPGEQ